MSYIKSRKRVVARVHRTTAATLATGIALALPASLQVLVQSTTVPAGT